MIYFRTGDLSTSTSTTIRESGLIRSNVGTTALRTKEASEIATSREPRNTRLTTTLQHSTSIGIDN